MGPKNPPPQKKDCYLFAKRQKTEDFQKPHFKEHKILYKNQENLKILVGPPSGFNGTAPRLEFLESLFNFHTC